MMGDEADAMWDAEMLEEGREFAENHTREMLQRAVRSHTFRKAKTKKRALPQEGGER